MQEVESQPITDEMLSRAAEGNDVEVKEEAEVKLDVEVEPLEGDKEEEKVPVEPTDNRERSNLGRKVAALETTIAEFIQAQTEAIKPTQEVEQPDLDLDGDIPLTKKDLDNYFANQSKEKTRYNTSYLNQVSKIGLDDSDDLFNSVLVEMETGKYNAYTGDAVRDAEVNYLKATKAVLSVKGDTKVNPLNKNTGKQTKGLGINGDTRVENKTAALPELDEHAKSYAKKMGMSEAEIRSALSGKGVKASGDTLI